MKTSISANSLVSGHYFLLLALPTPFPGQATPTLWAGPQALRAQAMGSYFADLLSSGYVQKSSISLGTPHDCRLHSLDQHGPR